MQNRPKILERLFRRKPSSETITPLNGESRPLDQVAHMTRATVGFMLLPLIERSPELAWMAEEGRESNWDFFFTAAVLALVGAKRSREGTLAERAKVLKRCDEEANRWDPQASEATIDFMTFFDKNVEAGFAPETAIGVWLLVNVRGEWPTHDQMGPAPGLGAMVIKIASEWY